MFSLCFVQIKNTLSTECGKLNKTRIWEFSMLKDDKICSKQNKDVYALRGLTFTYSPPFSPFPIKEQEPYLKYMSFALTEDSNVGSSRVV